MGSPVFIEVAPAIAEAMHVQEIPDVPNPVTRIGCHLIPTRVVTRAGPRRALDVYNPVPQALEAKNVLEIVPGVAAKGIPQHEAGDDDGETAHDSPPCN